MRTGVEREGREKNIRVQSAILGVKSPFTKKEVGIQTPYKFLFYGVCDVVTANVNVAASYNDLGLVHRQLGDLTQAKDFHEGAPPHSPGRVRNKRECSLF